MYEQTNNSRNQNTVSRFSLSVGFGQNSKLGVQAVKMLLSQSVAVTLSDSTRSLLIFSNTKRRDIDFNVMDLNIVSIFHYISNKKQRYTYIYIYLYPETALYV
jgi:hypothetical protein